jgi:hypothetical protein
MVVEESRVRERVAAHFSALGSGEVVSEFALSSGGGIPIAAL